MNKFTDNAYQFINNNIGFHRDFKVTVGGAVNRSPRSLANYTFDNELKYMTIKEIEIQYNSIYIIVDKKECTCYN